MFFPPEIDMEAYFFALKKTSKKCSKSKSILSYIRMRVCGEIYTIISKYRYKIRTILYDGWTDWYWDWFSDGHRLILEIRRWFHPWWFQLGQEKDIVDIVTWVQSIKPVYIRTRKRGCRVVVIDRSNVYVAFVIQIRVTKRGSRSRSRWTGTRSTTTIDMFVIIDIVMSD